MHEKVKSNYALQSFQSKHKLISKNRHILSISKHVFSRLSSEAAPSLEDYASLLSVQILLNNIKQTKYC